MSAWRGVSFGFLHGRPDPIKSRPHFPAKTRPSSRQPGQSFAAAPSPPRIAPTASARSSLPGNRRDPREKITDNDDEA